MSSLPEAVHESFEFYNEEWGGEWTTLGGIGTAILTGGNQHKKNRSKVCECRARMDKIDYAAKVCVSLVVTKDGVVYDNWFLPSKDKLNSLYQDFYRKAIGGFSDEDYWSSSESDVNIAWGQYFYNGGFRHTIIVGSTTSASGLYGLSDELFTDISMYHLKGSRGLEPPADQNWNRLEVIFFLV